MSSFTEFEQDKYAVIEAKEGDCEKVYNNETCYLGLPFYDVLYKTYAIASTIRADTFYTYANNDLMFYLYHNSITRIKKPKIEIMKLYITKQPDTEVNNKPFDFTSNCDMDVYEVVIKTFWLKIIQRRWKTVYANRMAWCKARMSEKYLHHRAIHGKGEVNPFGLKGILSYLRVSK